MARPTRTQWGNDFNDEESDRRRLLDEPHSSYQSAQRQIREHEEGLDRLGEAIKRQKYMANELATEVEVHNEILDDIDQGLGRTNENLRKNTRNINVVMRKSGTCFLWSLILILAIVIAVLAII